MQSRVDSILVSFIGGNATMARGGAMMEPGQRVRHPGQPGWGDGQVQSVVGERVTVNFENAGKVLVNARLVTLQVLDDDRPALRPKEH
jgi:Protein of unknown function (DUF3553)